MSKLALVAVLVMSMALAPLLAAGTHPKGEHPPKHPANRNSGKDQKGKNGRSLLKNPIIPQEGYYSKKTKDAQDPTREGEPNNDKPYHRDTTIRQGHRDGQPDNDKPYHRDTTRQGHRDGQPNTDDSYRSERVYYTRRNQRNRVKPARNGKPAHNNGRNGPKTDKEQHDAKKNLPAPQGAAATHVTEPAPATPVPIAATPVGPQLAKSEPVNAVAAPTTPVPAKSSEPAAAAPVTPAPAKTYEPSTAAPVTPAPAKTEPATTAPVVTPAPAKTSEPAKPVDATGSAPTTTGRSLLAINHDGHDHDDHDHDHFVGGRNSQLVPHGDHFDKVPVGGSSPWGTELIRHGDHFDRVPVFDTTRANPLHRSSDWDSIGHLIGGIGNIISNGRRWLLASQDAAPAVKSPPMGTLKVQDPLAAAKSALLKSKAAPVVPKAAAPLSGLKKLRNPLAAPKKAVHNVMHKAADSMSKAAHELPKAAANLPKELSKLPKAVGLPRSLLASNTEIIVVNPRSGHHHHRRVRCGLLWCWN